jgi:hypothetical protein
MRSRLLMSGMTNSRSTILASPSAHVSTSYAFTVTNSRSASLSSRCTADGALAHAAGPSSSSSPAAASARSSSLALSASSPSNGIRRASSQPKTSRLGALYHPLPSACRSRTLSCVTAADASTSPTLPDRSIHRRTSLG